MGAERMEPGVVLVQLEPGCGACLPQTSALGSWAVMLGGMQHTLLSPLEARERCRVSQLVPVLVIESTNTPKVYPLSAGVNEN